MSLSRRWGRGALSPSCDKCEDFHKSYVVPLRVGSVPLENLQAYRARCSTCFDEKIAACNSYKADMQKHMGPDPKLNFTPAQVDANWKRCLVPIDQTYKDRALIDATIKRAQARKLQQNFNAFSAAAGAAAARPRPLFRPPPFFRPPTLFRRALFPRPFSH